MKKLKNKALAKYKFEHNLTAKQLASMSGVSTRHIYHILWGLRSPSKALAKRISEKTGIPVLSLLYPEEEEDKYEK